MPPIIIQVHPPLKPWPEGVVACICCRPTDPFWEDFGDSVDRRCYNCNCIVKVRPTTLHHHDLGGAEYVCVQCHALYVMGRGTPTHALPKSPAQIAERGTDQPVPTREEYVERYVAVMVENRVAEDTPELRQKAGEFYDLKKKD